jgi:hypothetical protein
VCYYNYKVHYTKKVPHEMPEQCPECIFPKPSFKENLEEDKQREIEKMKKNMCTIHKNGLSREGSQNNSREQGYSEGIEIPDCQNNYQMTSRDLQDEKNQPLIQQHAHS